MTRHGKAEQRPDIVELMAKVGYVPPNPKRPLAEYPAYQAKNVLYIFGSEKMLNEKNWGTRAFNKERRRVYELVEDASGIKHSTLYKLFSDSRDATAKTLTKFVYGLANLARTDGSKLQRGELAELITCFLLKDHRTLTDLKRLAVIATALALPDECLDGLLDAAGGELEKPEIFASLNAGYRERVGDLSVEVIARDGVLESIEAIKKAETMSDAEVTAQAKAPGLIAYVKGGYGMRGLLARLSSFDDDAKSSGESR